MMGVPETTAKTQRRGGSDETMNETNTSERPQNEDGPLVGTTYAERPEGGVVLGSSWQGGTVVRTKGISGVKGNRANQSMSRAQRSVVAVERERECWSLRTGGATFDQIAAKLGVSTKSASRIFQRALRKHIQLTGLQVKEHVFVENAKLTRLENSMLKIVVSETAENKEKTDAVNAIIKVMDRRAKYFNLDYPDFAQGEAKYEDTAAVLVPRVKGRTIDQMEHLASIFADAAERSQKVDSLPIGGADPPLTDDESEEQEPESPEPMTEDEPTARPEDGTIPSDPETA